MKVVNCPFNLLHLFGVCITSLLCLAHDLTLLAAAGDVRSLLSSTPWQLINTREVFLPVSGSSEKWELGCLDERSRKAVVSKNIMFQRMGNLSRKDSATFSRSGTSAAQRC